MFTDPKHKLKEFKRLNKYTILTKWQDGFSAVIKIADLRKYCPCEDCMIERNKPVQKSPLALPVVKSGEYEINKITRIGNYGLQFVFGDSHDGGFYTWDLLRNLFERFQLSDKEVERLDSLAASGDPTPQNPHHCNGNNPLHDPNDPRCCHDIKD